MATHQYIGARYVPYIFGTWRSGISYEPLTVVTYMGRSFTSKLAVPADIADAPPDAPEYWVETGSYNSQVAQLQESYDELNHRISQVESTVRDVVIIADSYGTYNGAGNDHTMQYNIRDRLVSYLGWDSDFIHYSAQNGAGFCNGLFESQLDALYASGSSSDWTADVTDVYVLGGWNDESNRDGVSEATFNTKAADFKEKAIVYFPNARLHIAFAAWSFQTTRTNQELRTTLSWYRNLTKSGWVFDENMQYVMHNSTLFIGGNLHPNQDGINALADALAQIILNDECHVSYNLTCGSANITLPGTLPASSSLTLYTQLRDSIAIVELYAQRGCITLTETGSLALDGAHTIELFTFTGATTVKGYTNRVAGPCTVSILNDGTRYEVPGFITIADGSVKFFPDYYPEGSTYLTLSSISKITIPKVTFACKAW